MGYTYITRHGCVYTQFAFLYIRINIFKVHMIYECLQSFLRWKVIRYERRKSHKEYWPTKVEILVIVMFYCQKLIR